MPSTRLCLVLGLPLVFVLQVVGEDDRDVGYTKNLEGLMGKASFYDKKWMVCTASPIPLVWPYVTRPVVCVSHSCLLCMLFPPGAGLMRCLDTCTQTRSAGAAC